MEKIIIIFGYGYLAQFFSNLLCNHGWQVYCTSRSVPMDQIINLGKVRIVNFTSSFLIDLFKKSDFVLSTVPPDLSKSDPVIFKYLNQLIEKKFKWIGYISSTSVYGNHKGSWVDEDSKCVPTNLNSKIRFEVENSWLNLYFNLNLPIHIFRLSGIYGPNRNCLEDLKKGKDFTFFKKDFFFSRIHIADICQVLDVSLKNPTPGEIYNISDCEPSPMHVVHQFAAKLLKKEKLKELEVEKADLSLRMQDFFNDHKKVSNKKIIKNFNLNLYYPTYREGLLNCFSQIT